MAKKDDRDIEKRYPAGQMVMKLRRLADSLEQGKPFRIQIAGEKVNIPVDAVFNIEHEREGDLEEVEFQFKWRRRGWRFICRVQALENGLPKARLQKAGGGFFSSRYRALTF
ncbi:MAG: amphi-Trp domain-containing protein [Desulfobacterales bacterium]